jgi:hypothetical protein
MKTVMPTIAAATAAMASGLVYATPSESPVQSVFPQIHEEVSQMIVRPKNKIELAKNLKYIFDHDLQLQDEFYTEASLKDVFNFDAMVINKSEDDNGDRRILVLANGLSATFPDPKIPGSTNSMPGADLAAGKTIYQTGAITAYINFSMNEGGPSFDETWKIFEGKFSNLDPQPHGTFGGPLPTRVPHGNGSWRRQWVDGQSEKTLTLSFNRDAELSHILIEIKNN